MPGVGIQVPPNLSDWWPELVRAGATDLGGLSANGDHISPEHPFPSPTQVRKRLAGDGFALTERLCVYPEYIDREWIAEPVLDVIKSRYWSFIPRRGSGRRAELRVADDAAPRAIERAARGQRADARGADRAVRRAAPRGDRGHARRRRRAAPPPGRRHRHVRRQPQHQRLQRVHGRAARSAASASRALARRLRALARGVRAARPRGGRGRRDRDLHPVRDPPRLGAGGLRGLAAVRQADRAPAAPARLLADGGRAHVRRQRPGAAGGVRAAARGRARVDARHGGRGPARRRPRADLAQQAAGGALGARSSRPRTPRASARP